MSGIGVSASGELTKKEKSMATVVTWVSPGSGTYWVTATITCIIIRRLKEGFLAGNLAMCRFYSKHLAMREYLCLRVISSNVVYDSDRDQGHRGRRSSHTV